MFVGGFVLGIGVVVIFVVWNDFEFGVVSFIVGWFDIVGVMDGIMFLSYVIVGIVVMLNF